MNIKNLFFLTCLLALVFTTTQCGEPAAPVTGTTVEGKFTNAANLQVFIDKSSVSNSNQAIKSGDTDGSGSFKINIPDGLEPGVYRARVGAQKAYFVLSGAENKISFSGDLSGLNQFDYQVDGAPATAELIELMKGFKAKTPTSEEAKTKLMTVDNPFVAMYAAHLMFPPSPNLDLTQRKIDVQQSALAKAKAQYPTASATKDFETIIKAEAGQLAAQMAQQKIRVGQDAPDISLQSPDGKTYSLSDLKGKVVLLDFWASWCGPCRRENPNVVKTYKEFNKKGFEVFSVSLDGIHPQVRPKLKGQDQIDKQMASAKTKWKAAIKKDQLLWPYHVSDLQHWGSLAAKSYGVSSIPKTFLIGRDGKIAAVNPRGPALEPALKKLL